MKTISYQKAIDLLLKVSTPFGFVASAEDTANYKRIWARDGVICGLAALASGNKALIQTFEKTLETLAKNQHEFGTIPSNVLHHEENVEVSYGGLAGRVDAVTWFIIGVCQFALHQKNTEIINKYESHIQKAIQLLNAWEFNNKHLLYVPLSGNWADEYITDGYVLYDQLLRLWALQLYNKCNPNQIINAKCIAIKKQLETNFLPNAIEEKLHERAYNEFEFKEFYPCSFSPSGYKKSFDALANSLAVLLNLGSQSQQNNVIDFSLQLQNQTTLGLLPAFWPPIFPNDSEWNLLNNNCKYEFRNYPYEFHNGGSWAMVNGFFGLALCKHTKIQEAEQLLQNINNANAKENDAFYENFNTKTTAANGVPFCAWSAAAAILVHQNIYANFKLTI